MGYNEICVVERSRGTAAFPGRCRTPRRGAGSAGTAGRGKGCARTPQPKPRPPLPSTVQRGEREVRPRSRAELVWSQRRRSRSLKTMSRACDDNRRRRRHTRRARGERVTRRCAVAPPAPRSVAHSQVRQAAPFSLTAFSIPHPPLQPAPMNLCSPSHTCSPRHVAPTCLHSEHRARIPFAPITSVAGHASACAWHRTWSQCPPLSPGILPNGVRGAALHAPSTAHAVGVSATRPSQPIPSTPPTPRVLPAGPGCRMGLPTGHQGHAHRRLDRGPLTPPRSRGHLRAPVQCHVEHGVMRGARPGRDAH
jgi:hypothetical protein